MSATTFPTHQKTETEHAEHAMPTWLKWVLAAAAAAVLAASITLIAVNTGDDSVSGTVGVSDAQPATYQDLRLAAEWAEYMEAIRPGSIEGTGSATWQDLMRAAAYAERADR